MGVVQWRSRAEELAVSVISTRTAIAKDTMEPSGRILEPRLLRLRG